MPDQKLTTLTISGFKSFAATAPDEFADLDSTNGNCLRFGDVTVLLGANGAGKSNVVSLFRLLDAMLSGGLQDFVGRNGGAESLLHFGPRTTPSLTFTLESESDDIASQYSVTLSAAAPDTLSIPVEHWEFYLKKVNVHKSSDMGMAGRLECHLRIGPTQSDAFDNGLLRLLRGCRTYQFHDTTENARIRKASYIEDAAQLRGDAGNLAAFLFSLKLNHADYFERIVHTIQQVCPQFGGFELAPSPRNANSILLNWKDRSRPDHLMGPHQLSDGTLRFMALATLFLQPPDMLPPVIIIDEPELGLHPMALAILAGLVRGVAGKSQVILATQSETLVNHFEVEEITPVSTVGGKSRFLHLSPEDYTQWLEDYTLGELWEKNVLGGGPRRG